MQSVKYNSFTLLELLIVVSIASVLFFFVSPLIVIDRDNNLKLENLKRYMLDKNITEIICFQKEKNFDCNICPTKDNEKLKPLNLTLPRKIDVYKLDNTMIKTESIDYSNKKCGYRVKKDNFENFNVGFYYKLKENEFKDEFVVVTKEKVYMFTNVNRDVLIYDSIEDVRDSYENLLYELQDVI
jgi:hypothetical protein